MNKETRDKIEVVGLLILICSPIVLMGGLFGYAFLSSLNKVAYVEKLEYVGILESYVTNPNDNDYLKLKFNDGNSWKLDKRENVTIGKTYKLTIEIIYYQSKVQGTKSIVTNLEEL